MKLNFVSSVPIVVLVLLATVAASSQEHISLLTERQLKDLRIHSARPIQATPGQTLHLKIKAWQEGRVPPILVDVLVKAKWSVVPEYGIQLNTHTGELNINETAKPGAEYTITAVVAVGNDQKIITNTLHVFTDASNPFVGQWTDMNKQIRELIFGADGAFAVTAIPFEIYKDYWGKYSFNLKQRTILFEVTGGNNIPKDLDLEGTFRFSANHTLVLEDIYFGTLKKEFMKREGYTFEKRY